MACSIWPPFQLSAFTATACAILAVLSITGNALICCAVWRDPFKKLRTPFAYFLVNLAVSDSIVGFFTLPIGVYVHIREYLGYVSRLESRIIGMTFFISATASIFSLIALSLDRYAAITFAIKYRQYLTVRKCVLISCLIWLLSLTIPWIYLKLGYISYIMFYSHSAIVIGLVVLTTTYVKVYLFLRRQTREMSVIQRTGSTVAEEMRDRRLKTEKKVSRTFMWILALYVSTYIPVLLLVYVIEFCTSCDCVLIHVLRDVEFLLVLSNSATNPILCTCRLQDYRKAIKRIIEEAIGTQSCFPYNGFRIAEFHGASPSGSMTSPSAAVVESEGEGKPLGDKITACDKEKPLDVQTTA